MKLYDDLGDVAKKLLSDDFSTNNKVKFVSKTADGTTITVSGVTSSKIDGYTGDLSLKAKSSPALTFTTKLSTASTLPTLEAKYESSRPAPGSSSVTVSGNGVDKFGIKAQVKTPRLGMLIDTNVMTKLATISTTAAVSPATYSGFAVLGARTTLSSTGDMSNSSVALSFFDGKQSEIHCAVHNPQAPSALTASYSHLVRPGFSVAAVLDQKRSERSDPITTTTTTTTTTLGMAAALKIDPVTTIKSRIDTNGNVALAYVQKMRPYTDVSFSSVFNVTDLENTKVGCSITID